MWYCITKSADIPPWFFHHTSQGSYGPHRTFFSMVASSAFAFNTYLNRLEICYMSQGRRVFSHGGWCPFDELIRYARIDGTLPKGRLKNVKNSGGSCLLHQLQWTWLMPRHDQSNPSDDILNWINRISSMGCSFNYCNWTCWINHSDKFCVGHTGAVAEIVLQSLTTFEDSVILLWRRSWGSYKSDIWWTSFFFFLL